MEAQKKQLETEIQKRTQLERNASNHNAEIVKLKDRSAQVEANLKKAEAELHQRDWEVKQLRSKQDKTIVEHVHVLEEAKRVTDRQLAETQVELQKMSNYVKSLEKAKARMNMDAEDLTREIERERHELRNKEKATRAQEERALRAQEDVEKERKMREAAESATRRVQHELKNTQSQLADAQQQVANAERAKQNFELELANIAGDSDISNPSDKMKRQYEMKIAQMEAKLEDAEVARSTSERIRQRVDKQHAELRRLITSNGPRDDSFISRLLKELESADHEMANLSSRMPQRRSTEVHTFANVPPAKRHSDVNGLIRPRKDSQPELPKAPDRQVNQLRQQVQVLELQMLASDRVRQHLESSLRELTSDLDKSDGSKQSIQAYRSKLAKENSRLGELLDEEAEARRTAEAAQMDGVKAMWSKFQGTISAERESYAKLEESRKALVCPILLFFI
jgi:myosin protein heavy chain